MPGHIVLVGLMGAGKTTVGRQLAALLGRPFVDNDQQVVAASGRTVAEISTRAGVAEMRRLEREALAEALESRVPAVITAAAGVVLDDETRRWLCAPFVAWLRVDPATLAVRVSHDPVRPLLGDDPVTPRPTGDYQGLCGEEPPDHVREASDPPGDGSPRPA
jgi:shikimate kinase